MTGSDQKTDLSNGYQAIADEFRYWREQSVVGSDTVRRWALQLPKGGDVLDLGCGSGLPLGLVLQQAGLTLYGIDASPTLCAAYRQHLPRATVACEAVQHSAWFGRQFDGVLAVGLLFLLPIDTQLALFAKVAQALRPGGRFLFSAPAQCCSWTDVLTGQHSVSPGAAAYQAAAAAAGLQLDAQLQDSGGNHYFAMRRSDLAQHPAGVAG